MKVVKFKAFRDQCCSIL